MATELIATTCTRCGSDMELPEHILGLDAEGIVDEWLCSKCIQELIAEVKGQRVKQKAKEVTT